MDSLFVLGVKDDRTLRLFGKMGYDVVTVQTESAVPAALASRVFDLIVLDSRLSEDSLELCKYFRRFEKTKAIPILYIGNSPKIARELKEFADQTLEILEAEISPGSLLAKIATRLRMRKIAGEDSDNATLAEANASLRDLNEHFNRELDEARAIQCSLLPESLPTNPKFELAAAYQPLEQVGGDWYYTRMMSSGKLSVQIADVSGHGLSAAFLGSMTRLAVFAADEEAPNKLLEEVNRLLAPQMPEGRFVTMAAYSYDPLTGAFEYARAGHTPCIVVHRDGSKIEMLKGSGFAVGFMADGEYSLEKTTLQPGDMALIFTDGISEAQNRSGENYGHDRLANTIAAMPEGTSAQAILKSVWDSFNAFRDDRILKDDVTALVLRRTA